MIRILLILIPILTFVVPARFFIYYAVILLTAAVYGGAMFLLLNAQANAAFVEFGALVVFGFIALNLGLLVARYLLIRRARARILKLPAPIPKA